MHQKIKAPVLVVCGSRDVLYSAFGCSDQAERYTGAAAHGSQIVKGAGHALPLERHGAATSARGVGALASSSYGF